MKITIDKKCISLEEAPEADKVRKEWSTYDKETINCCIREAVYVNRHRITEITDRPFYPDEIKVLEIKSMTLCKNQYRFTVWIDATVRCGRDAIVDIEFDGAQCIGCIGENGVDASIDVYKLVSV